MSYGAYFTMLFLEPLVFPRVARCFYDEVEIFKPKAGPLLSVHARLTLLVLNLVLLPLLLLELKRRVGVTGDYAIVVVTFVFAAGSLETLYHSIAKPLDELNRKMTRLAAGDYAVKTTVLDDDEIGVLKAHFNDMVEGLAERERLKDTFGRYVSVEVAKKLIESGKVSLGGESIEATILFSDIRDFTPLSEKLTPQELVSFLNEYFSYVTEPIAALGMREALARFNASRPGLPLVAFGVGLHTGTLVAGNIGTEKRLESQNKELASTILVSEEVYSRLAAPLRDSVRAQRCEDVRLKGKQRALCRRRPPSRRTRPSSRGASSSRSSSPPWPSSGRPSRGCAGRLGGRRKLACSGPKTPPVPRRRGLPPLYADPTDIDTFLKMPRAAGGVEADVVEALRLMVEMFDSDLKEMQDTPENMERLKGAAGAISRALRKRGDGWTGGVLVPKTMKQLYALTTLNGSVLPQFDRILSKATEKALKEGRFEDVEGYGRKRLVLGWMMMWDWEPLSQSSGRTIANGGLLALRDAMVAQKRYCAADRQAGFRVVKQLMAFTAQPEELKKLQSAVTAQEMPRFDILQKYLDDPLLRPRYADAALKYAAHEGTRGPAQIESARAEFLRAASRHADPRVARLATGYALVHADYNKPAVEGSLKEAALKLLGPAP